MDVREPMDGLEALGWGPFFARQLGAAGEEGLLPARVGEDLGVAWRVRVGPGDEFALR